MSRSIRPSIVRSLVLTGLLLTGAEVAGAQQAVAPATDVPATVSAGTAGKIGVIDIGRLMQESATGRQALSSLQDLQNRKKTGMDTLAAEAKELQAKVQESELTLAEDKMIELRKQLEDKMIEIQRFQTDGQRELDKAQQEAFAAIQKKVFPIINEVGREGSFTLIFRKFESGLIFAVDEVDITDRVIARLDLTAES